MARLRVVIDSQISNLEQNKRYRNAGDRRQLVIAISNYLASLAGGGPFRPVLFQVQSDDAGVRASGTVTPASVLAADTVTINGVVFTAVASNPAANQFLAGTNPVTGASLAAAINASTSGSIRGYVSATANATTGVVTITAQMCGYPGNLFPLASSNGTRLAVSGATLTGGTEDAGYQQFSL